MRAAVGQSRSVRCNCVLQRPGQVVVPCDWAVVVAASHLVTRPAVLSCCRRAANVPPPRARIPQRARGSRGPPVRVCSPLSAFDWARMRRRRGGNLGVTWSLHDSLAAGCGRPWRPRCVPPQPALCGCSGIPRIPVSNRRVGALLHRGNEGPRRADRGGREPGNARGRGQAGWAAALALLADPGPNRPRRLKKTHGVQERLRRQPRRARASAGECRGRGDDAEHVVIVAVRRPAGDRPGRCPGALMHRPSRPRRRHTATFLAHR